MLAKNNTSTLPSAYHRANHAIERLLGAKLRDKITGAVHTVTGVLFTEENPDYVGFRLSEAQHDRYSFNVLMRDFVGHEARQGDAQAAIFNDGDGMQVVTIYEGGNITLSRQLPKVYTQPCAECSGTGEIITNTRYSLDPQEAYPVTCECCEGAGEIPASERVVEPVIEPTVDGEWEVAA